MSARLLSLQFQPRDNSGWITPVLTFGRVLTFLLGKNGSGKTPLAKGIAFALGHPVQLPPDIQTHCASVTLKLRKEDSVVQIERRLGESFDVSTTESDESKHFSDEKEFSSWLIEQLGIPFRDLAGRNDGIVPPYMSVLVPMFWIDQDLGWRNLYSPLSTHDFIKDQGEEITRWILGIPPKHRALDKSSFTLAKQRLESLQEQIAIKRKTLEDLHRELRPDMQPGGANSLNAKKDALLAELQTHSSVLETLAQANASFDSKIEETGRRREAADFALNSARQRQSQLSLLGNELTAEVDILEMNEVAADAFRTLCGNESCQFFKRPEESYGRRLLYLKDQLKDFQSSFSSLETEMEALRIEFTEAEAQHQRAVQERQLRISQSPGAQAVPIIDSLTKELADVNLRLARLERAEKEQERFNTLIDQALKAEEQVKQLRPTGGGSTDQTRLADARAELARSLSEWLMILRTQNVPQSVRFDEELRLNLDTVRFSENAPYSGSTRTRIVLAFHAALIETSIKIGGNHPGFLVLDTPKQHELHAADLHEFVLRFQAMSEHQPNPVQLVIAATEEDFIGAGLDATIWRPTFGSEEQPRFFGPAPTTPSA